MDVQALGTAASGTCCRRHLTCCVLVHQCQQAAVHDGHKLGVHLAQRTGRTQLLPAQRGRLKLSKDSRREGLQCEDAGPGESGATQCWCCCNRAGPRRCCFAPWPPPGAQQLAQASSTRVQERGHRPPRCPQWCLLLHSSTSWRRRYGSGRGGARALPTDRHQRRCCCESWLPDGWNAPPKPSMRRCRLGSLPARLARPRGSRRAQQCLLLCRQHAVRLPALAAARCLVLWRPVAERAQPGLPLAARLRPPRVLQRVDRLWVLQRPVVAAAPAPVQWARQVPGWGPCCCVRQPLLLLLLLVGLLLPRDQAGQHLTTTAGRAPGVPWPCLICLHVPQLLRCVVDADVGCGGARAWVACCPGPLRWCCGGTVVAHKSGHKGMLGARQQAPAARGTLPSAVAVGGCEQGEQAQKPSAQAHRYAHGCPRT